MTQCVMTSAACVLHRRGAEDAEERGRVDVRRGEVPASRGGEPSGQAPRPGVARLGRMLNIT